MAWGLLALVVAVAAPARAQDPQDAQNDFASQVDLIRLGQVAVHQDGRLKSFDSFASTMLQMVTGPHRIDGQSPAFTYLDLIFRAERYENRPIIYVKNKQIREAIIRARAGAGAGGEAFEAWADRFFEEGLIERRILTDEQAVVQTLNRLGRDLVKTAKFVQQIETALFLTRQMEDEVIPPLLESWRVVPPAEGGVHTPWLSLVPIMGLHGRDVDLHGLDEATHERILEDWIALVSSWRQENAAGVNQASRQLAVTLSGINAEVYPHHNRLAWESWYFHQKNLTWVWLVYAFALIPLMLHLVFRWPAARWIGLGIFLLAFGLQTFALLLRWYVAQRFPNSNMFEAVTTSTWFGGCAAIILELLVRKTPMRGLFALVSAAASMLAFMCAHFQPMVLDPNLSNRMPVLHDVWLYIHTNVIIFSYCLIFMAAVSALLYLVYRFIGLIGEFGGPDDFARVGGAGSLIVTDPAGAAVVTTRARTSFGQVLDGTTMVLMELSFIMLWAGLVMGAIWADHSWGRPWGWDPKEVFALNTFIVFAILVHGRLKVKDKGLWTAVVAIIGAAVMMFNWFTINFVITGLHSYA